MNLRRTMIAAGWGFSVVVVPARAQGPCDVVIRQAAQLMGVPAGPASRLTPTPSTEVCVISSADKTASVQLTVMADKQPEQSAMMNRMIAGQAKDKDQTFRDEASLGKNAFSLRESDGVSLFMAGAARTLTLQLRKNRGFTDADVARAVALAKELVAAK